MDLSPFVEAVTGENFFILDHSFVKKDLILICLANSLTYQVVQKCSEAHTNWLYLFPSFPVRDVGIARVVIWEQKV